MKFVFALEVDVYVLLSAIKICKENCMIGSFLYFCLFGWIVILSKCYELLDFGRLLIPYYRRFEH